MIRRSVVAGWGAVQQRGRPAHEIFSSRLTTISGPPTLLLRRRQMCVQPGDWLMLLDFTLVRRRVHRTSHLGLDETKCVLYDGHRA